jgi:hypothetical protein
MSPDEFIAKYRTYERREIMTVVLCIIVWIGAGTYAGKVNKAGGCDSARCILSLLGAAGMVGCSLVYTLIHAPRARAEKLGLICPSCGESLASKEALLGMVAGKCKSCGNQILEPTSSASSDRKESIV